MLQSFECPLLQFRVGSSLESVPHLSSNIKAILGVQPSPRDSMNKEIFAMLDDIRIANKENPLSKSSNMAGMT